MIVGLCGPTNPEDPRREQIASKFSKHVFRFDDLTTQLAEKLSEAFTGKQWKRLSFDKQMEAKQHVEDTIRSIPDLKSFYTDWMTNQLAKTVYRQGLNVSSKVVEAVIADVKYPEWYKWLRPFGFSPQTMECRWNKTIYVPCEYFDGKEKPDWAIHESEEPEFETQEELRVTQTSGSQKITDAFVNEVDRLKRTIIRQ